MTRLILFDIDGTLLRTKGAGREATRRAMLEVFGTASRIDSHHFGGKTDWYTLVEQLTEHGYTPEQVGARMGDFEEAMGRHLSETIQTRGAKALPNALALVNQLRDDPRYMLGIVTGNTQASANVKLRSAGFDPAWFEVGAYGTESMDRNDLPRFAIERAVALRQKPFTPDAVIVIGDTLADIACARAVGAMAVAVCTGFEDRYLLIDAKPDHLLDDLTTFLDILD